MKFKRKNKLARALSQTLALAIFVVSLALLVWSPGWDSSSAALGAPIVAQASSEATDQTPDWLPNRSYPWYDVKAQQIKPLETQTESTSKSGIRNDIEKGIVKTKAAKPATPRGPVTTRGTNTSGGLDLATFFTALLVVIIAVALGFLIHKFLKIESSSEGDSLNKRKLLSESIEQLPFDLQVKNGDFLSLAQTAYQAGDLRRAIILLYSHVLVTLDQNERIELKKGKTNRQYLKEVWQDPPVSKYFKSVMLPFESAFFGNHVPEAQGFERCWAGLDEFHQRVNQPVGDVT